MAGRTKIGGTPDTAGKRHDMYGDQQVPSPNSLLILPLPPTSSIHLHVLYTMKLSPSFSLLLAALPYALAAPYNASRFTPRATPGEKPVIIQMFQWNYDSVAAECRDFIGPAGYGYVQVSPAQEHVARGEWWSDYQPVSYKLASKHGNRDQFKAMVDACHNAGVGVLVDTVINHMAGFDSGVGTAGSSFTHYDYPGIYQYQDFHHCSSPGSDIQNYEKKPETQECELSNLADLNTASDYVRWKLADHIQDLMSLGADGLRIDAAKHMPAFDIQDILNRVSTKPKYITQEVVVWGNDGDVRAEEYVGIGDVQEFRFAAEMKQRFGSGGDISGLEHLDSRGWTPSNKANVFVANHDGERAGYSLNAESPDNAYMLASIFTLAHSYGTPTVLSSYAGFDDRGGPNGGYGTCSESSGSNGWYCQHRWTPIAGMVRFHNTVGSEPVQNWTSEGGSKIAFSRGNKGFVVINKGGDSWSRTFSTSLPDGYYCDVITTGCSNRVHVSGGQASVNLAARSAIAVHVGEPAYCGAHHTSC